MKYTGNWMSYLLLSINSYGNAEHIFSPCGKQEIRDTSAISLTFYSWASWEEWYSID